MKKTFQFGICGAFDFEEKATGGQSVKTREFYLALSEKIGQANICILESTEYKKNPISFLVKFVRMMAKSENVLVFPAQKGIKIFAPLCRFLKGPCQTKTYYDVIGGWLAKIADENPGLRKSLVAFDAILVETNQMKEELGKRNISNVVRLRNFKAVKPLQESQVKAVTSPVRLCYFSRVTKMKGIADAVAVVNKINEHGTKCIFDIYGPVTDGYDEEFKQLQNTFGGEITYKGKVDPSDSVKIISQYDLQLFPTHYKTEGIPGAILDSYFAGVPVVTARWNSFSDVIIEGKTGIGYEMGDIDDFLLQLSWLINDKEKTMEMKQCALKEAKDYMPETVIEEFLQITRGS